MRTYNSAKNAIVAGILNVVTIVIGFISQKIFINILGLEYLGINGLFSNILSMLSIVELGLGSAIVYHMYKPIADDNKEEIKSLMSFYKTGYRIVAIVVLVLGIILMPFSKYIIKDVTISENLLFLYILSLMDVVFSYLLTYKRSILYANQKAYIINLIHIFYLILLNFFQLLFLFLTKSYVLYLLIKIIFRILENIIITLISNRMYPFLKDKDIKPIDEKLKRDIFSKIKGLLYHKIGTFVVLGTDNIIISTFLGIIVVGLYDNYYLIINKVQGLFSQVFNSITASIGNLLVEDNKNKTYHIYKNILFINSLIYVNLASGLLCIIQPFIRLWIGEQYLLSKGTLLVLIINFYLQGMRLTSMSFKNAAGVFYEDRLMPILEAVINIIMSIIFVLLFGLKGVFLGTISSTIILYVYGYYKYVYNKLFQYNYKKYISDNIMYFILPLVIFVILYILTGVLTINNSLLCIGIYSIVSILITNIIYYLFFKDRTEFKYFLSLVKKIIKTKKPNTI